MVILKDPKPKPRSNIHYLPPKKVQLTHHHTGPRGLTLANICQIPLQFLLIMLHNLPQGIINRHYGVGDADPGGVIKYVWGHSGVWVHVKLKPQVPCSLKSCEEGAHPDPTAEIVRLDSTRTLGGSTSRAGGQITASGRYPCIVALACQWMEIQNLVCRRRVRGQ